MFVAFIRSFAAFAALAGIGANYEGCYFHSGSVHVSHHRLSPLNLNSVDCP